MQMSGVSPPSRSGRARELPPLQWGRDGFDCISMLQKVSHFVQECSTIY